jgi:hypothetical protein
MILPYFWLQTDDSSIPQVPFGLKMTNYAAQATAENVALELPLFNWELSPL